MILEEMVKFIEGDETVRGFLAAPDKTDNPAVLVLHAWWGLTEAFKQICSSLATEGFVAFAPDLYAGNTAKTIEEAEGLSSRLKREDAERLLDAASQYLLSLPVTCGGQMGVVGFSMGASLALGLAESRPEEIAAVVLFYGTRPVTQSKARAAFLGHYAEKDPYEPDDEVKALENSLLSTGKEVKYYTYPGTGHWFFEPDRPQAYNPQAAGLAWERTLKFLREKL